MKVLTPASEIKATLNTTPSRVFGTSASYVLYDTESNEFNCIPNTFYGAKVLDIAHDLTDLGVTDIIADIICRTCYRNLKEAGMRIWKDNTSVTIRESYQKFYVCGMFQIDENITLRMHDKSHNHKIKEMDELDTYIKS